MTESSSQKEWELEEAEDADNQWQLLETEQELPPEMRLQESPAPQQGWQPVEQTDEPSSGGRNWVLPFFIILAMIAVVAYIVWLGFSGVDFLPGVGSSLTQAPTAVVEEPSVEVVPQNQGESETAAVADTATPVPEPTATIAPTATPEPPPAMVEQFFATIASQYGLNARANPTTDGEVVRILNDGDRYPIVEQGPEWTQIELEDGTRVWVSSEFISLSSQEVILDEAVNPPAADVGDSEASDDAAPQQQSTGIQPDAPFTDVIPAGPAVLILADGGVNARTTPDTAASNVLQTIPQGAALAAIGQSADGEWVQVEMPNGTAAWVFLDAVDTSGDVAGLSVVVTETETEPDEVPAEEPEIAPEEAVDETTSEAEAESEPGADADEASAESETEPVTEDTATESIDAQITVESLIGIKARTEPQQDAEAIEVLSRGTTAPAIGRTDDGAWIQVTLANGETGWVRTGTVQLSVEPSTLPVVEP